MAISESEILHLLNVCFNVIFYLLPTRVLNICLYNHVCTRQITVDPMPLGCPLDFLCPEINEDICRAGSQPCFPSPLLLLPWGWQHLVLAAWSAHSSFAAPGSPCAWICGCPSLAARGVHSSLVVVRGNSERLPQPTVLFTDPECYGQHAVDRATQPSHLQHR